MCVHVRTLLCRCMDVRGRVHTATRNPFLCRCVDDGVCPCTTSKDCACVHACSCALGTRAYGLLENAREGNEESHNELLDLLATVRSLLQGLRKIKDLQSQVRFLTYRTHTNPRAPTSATYAHMDSVTYAHMNERSACFPSPRRLVRACVCPHLVFSCKDRLMRMRGAWLSFCAD